MSDEVDFLPVDKHESVLQVDFNTLGIKVSYRVILSLLLGIIKHPQSIQSNKFTISLQYLKKEVRNAVHFLQADKHESFYKSALSLLTEAARHVQSTKNRELVIFLQYKKKCFDAKHLDILWGSSPVRCYLSLQVLVLLKWQLFVRAKM